MFFRDFPGHTSTKDYFRKIVSENRVPHALLLVGPEGYGKLSLALGLASLLQCQSPENNSACGICSSCIKSQNLVHPDIHFAFPVIKKDDLKREDITSVNFIEDWRSFVKSNPWGNLNDWLSHINGLDKSANINVKECHSIIKTLGLKSYEGKFKVQIIWQAELLGKESNRLLKIIEEPSPDTIIILISNNRNAILNTIRSRCQIVSIPPFLDEDINHYLEKTTNLDDKIRNEICFIASGNMRKAIQLSADNSLKHSEDIIKWFSVGLQGDPEAIIEWIDYLASKGRQDLKSFISYGLHFLREYMLGLHTKSTDGLRLSSEEKNQILKLQRIINEEKTLRLEKLLGPSIGYIDRNLSLKILLMHLTIEMNSILKTEVNNFVT